MHDAMIMEISHTLNQTFEPVADLVKRKPLRILLQNAGQARPGDVFHDDEIVTGVVTLQVVNREQIGALEVHALHDTAALDVEVTEDQLKGDFLPRVGRGVIDLSEASATDSPLDRVAVERSSP
jgi:hypothetical protein